MDGVQELLNPVDVIKRWIDCEGAFISVDVSGQPGSLTVRRCYRGSGGRRITLNADYIQEPSSVCLLAAGKL
jgi:hypothetical protein